MPRPSLLPLSCLGLLLLTPGLAAHQDPLRDLDAYVERALRDWEAPGLAVAVVRNDSLVLARGYGVRRLGRADPVDAHTLFAVGSTTKAFTAALLGMLVDEGRIAWDSRAAEHLPGFQLHDPYVTRELTVRDLLTHRTGLARGDRLWAASGLGREEVLRRVRFLEPSWSFRARYGYQNIMYLAAGELAARLQGETWDEAVRRHILAPLGMSRSVTSVRALPAMDNVATPHERLADRVTPVEWLDIDNIGPAGSINSSVADMAQWIRLQLGLGTLDGRKFLDSGTVRETRTMQVPIRPSEADARLFPESHLMGYGLGWSLRDYRGRLVVSHGGAIRGMRAQVMLVPEERLGVVVLTNLAESGLTAALAWRVVDVHLGAPVKDWSALYLAEARAARTRGAEERRRVEAARVANTRPSLPLERYAGTYADSLYGEITVTREGDHLVARFGPEFTGDLVHWHFDTFEVVWRNPVLGRALMTFALDRRGSLAGVGLGDLGVFGRRAARP